MSEIKGCTDCAELAVVRRQIVVPTPCPPGRLLAIGEAPGSDEDLAGEGFIGQAGKRLDLLLEAHGLLRRRDYGVANLIRCRPPGNRKPAKGELVNCLPRLAEFLLDVRPKVLLLVGASAAAAFLGKEPLSTQIERSRGSALLLARHAHPALWDAIRSLHTNGAIQAVPMPHTSGLAWNRNAPNGRRWSKIGEEQVALAAGLLN